MTGELLAVDCMVPMYEERQPHGVDSGVPVLDLEHEPDKSRNVISSHLLKMATQNPSNAVILGCAGMTNIWDRLQLDHKITLIDPIAAAAKLVRAMI